MSGAAAVVRGDEGRNLPRLTETQLLVLIAIMGDHLSLGNVVEVSQGKIAAEIGIKRQNVNAAMLALCDRGVLAPIESAPGRHRRYLLDPAVAFYGDWEFHAHVVRKFTEARSDWWLTHPPQLQLARRRGRQ